jgi:hypothetical protein
MSVSSRMQACSHDLLLKKLILCRSRRPYITSSTFNYGVVQIQYKTRMRPLEEYLKEYQSTGSSVHSKRRRLSVTF